MAAIAHVFHKSDSKGFFTGLPEHGFDQWKLTVGEKTFLFRTSLVSPKMPQQRFGEAVNGTWTALSFRDLLSNHAKSNQYIRDLRKNDFLCGYDVYTQEEIALADAAWMALHAPVAAVAAQPAVAAEPAVAAVAAVAAQPAVAAVAAQPAVAAVAAEPAVPVANMTRQELTSALKTTQKLALQAQKWIDQAQEKLRVYRIRAQEAQTYLDRGLGTPAQQRILTELAGPDLARIEQWYAAGLPEHEQQLVTLQQRMLMLEAALAALPR